jgi:hypothetical protein
MREEPEEDLGYNPILRAQFLEVVENQLKANDPPETRETFDRLLSEGISEEDAKIYIAQAVCVEVLCILKQRKPFNLKRYVTNLKRLPEAPKE